MWCATSSPPSASVGLRTVGLCRTLQDFVGLCRTLQDFLQSPTKSYNVFRAKYCICNCIEMCLDFKIIFTFCIVHWGNCLTRDSLFCGGLGRPPPCYLDCFNAVLPQPRPWVVRATVIWLIQARKCKFCDLRPDIWGISATSRKKLRLRPKKFSLQPQSQDDSMMTLTFDIVFFFLRNIFGTKTITDNCKQILVLISLEFSSVYKSEW